jgi:hypothetical protein
MQVMKVVKRAGAEIARFETNELPKFPPATGSPGEVTEAWARRLAIGYLPQWLVEGGPLPGPLSTSDEEDASALCDVRGFQGRADTSWRHRCGSHAYAGGVVERVGDRRGNRHYG